MYTPPFRSRCIIFLAMQKQKEILLHWKRGSRILINAIASVKHKALELLPQALMNKEAASEEEGAGFMTRA